MAACFEVLNHLLVIVSDMETREQPEHFFLLEKQQESETTLLFYLVCKKSQFNRVPQQDHTVKMKTTFTNLAYYLVP